MIQIYSVQVKNCEFEFTICNEIIELEKWFALNKSSLNISKTNFMMFCKSQVKQNFQINFGNKLINKVL